MVMTTAP